MELRFGMMHRSCQRLRLRRYEDTCSKIYKMKDIRIILRIVMKEIPHRSQLQVDPTVPDNSQC
jgi:hypothetical protein